MVSRKVRIDSENRADFARFMKGERVYKTTIKFEDPTSDVVYEIPVEYEQATAFDFAAIYSDIDPSATLEDRFEYDMQLFNFCVKGRGVVFTNDDKGRADYGIGEISIRDLPFDEKQRLEMLFAPGVGKTGQQYEQELKADRRKNRKGVRRGAAEVAETTS